MRTVIVIPARFASTRLPAKPLLRETGKYLIEHVYEQAQLVHGVERILVATDDLRIRDAVRSFGGEAVMTLAEHASGTDRIAEVAEAMPDVDVFVNLQGDEPQFDPKAIETLIAMMADGAANMATLATPIRDRETYLNPNCVKVVCGENGRALYFSRSPIPHVRDGQPNFGTEKFLLHLGVYAYRRDSLLKLAKTPLHPLEHFEKLEQLRMLATGGTIRLAVVAKAHRGVDTPEDYASFVESYRRNTTRTAA